MLTSSKPENEQAVLTPLGYLNRTLLWKHEGSSAAITVTSRGAVTKMSYHLESRVCGFELPFAAYGVWAPGRSHCLSWMTRSLCWLWEVVQPAVAGVPLAFLPNLLLSPPFSPAFQHCLPTPLLPAPCRHAPQSCPGALGRELAGRDLAAGLVLSKADSVVCLIPLPFARVPKS